MKNIITTIYFCIISIIAFSQEWTEPVNISNMHAFLQSSDFCIDNSGVFHCVWNKKVDDNYSVLFYSKSIDEGLSWSEPEKISQNESRYYVYPQICADSENNLYVAFDNYDYSSTTESVFSSVIIFNDGSWSESYNLAEGLKSRIVVDYDVRVYVFWYQGTPHNGEFCYKYFENEYWSDTFIPFDDILSTISVLNVVVDNDNNLHCVGTYDPTTMLKKYPAYFSFNKMNQEWSIVEQLSTITGKTSDIDIVLDNSFFFHAAWDENRTAYSFFDGNIWSENEIVDLSYAKTVEVSVDIAGNPIIITTEDLNDNIELACYFKDNFGDWQRYIVDAGANTIFTPQLIIRNEYVIYQKSDSPQDADIYFCKTDLQLSLKDNESRIQYSAYPNPFSSVINFKWGSINSNNKSKGVIKIYNEFGRIVHTAIIYNEFEQSYTWDGMNANGNCVKPGIYIGEILFSDYKIFMKFIKM